MINLGKGEKIMLEKSNDSGNKLNMLAIGLGWDENSGSGADFDLDAVAVALDENGKALPGGMLFYNSPKNAEGKLHILDGALIHSGDNLTGDAEGDDETIMLELSKVPANVASIAIIANIHMGAERNQNFGMVNNAYIRLLNSNKNDEELIHYDLNWDASTATGVKFATIMRRNGEWGFSADNVEFAAGLETVVSEFSVTS